MYVQLKVCSWLNRLCIISRSLSNKGKLTWYHIRSVEYQIGLTRGMCFSYCLILLALLATGVSVVSCHEQEVTVTLLSERIDPLLRYKRSVDSTLPDNLDFRVDLNDEKIKLRLRRSSLLAVTASDPHTTLLANHLPENADFYVDMEKESAVIVQQNASDYQLSGIFAHGQKLWDLTPVDGNIHRVQPWKTLNETISFIGDEVTLPNEKDPMDLVDQTLGEIGRHKRAVSQHKIEIFFVVDYADYTRWVSYFSFNALSRMRLWYTYVAQSIKVRFQSIQDPTIAISTSVTGLKILTNANDDKFLNDISTNNVFAASNGLTAFINWYQQQSDITASDHYILFTGHDIVSETSAGNPSKTCTKDGVSIVENRFSGMVGLNAARQLGRSLSAVYDKDTSCPETKQFVMSSAFSIPVLAVNEGNPWKFSTCSVNSFKSYLRTVACTLPENSVSTDFLPMQDDGSGGGEILNLDEQCQHFFGSSSSTYCRDQQIAQGGEEKLCGGMYCKLPGGSTCQAMIPQEFTPCADNKWCVAGLCVDTITTTPTTRPTTTPQDECVQYVRTDIIKYLACLALRRRTTTVATTLTTTTTTTAPTTTATTTTTRPTTTATTSTSTRTTITTRTTTPVNCVQYLRVSIIRYRACKLLSGANNL